jgi:hypothetical protein
MMIQVEVFWVVTSCSVVIGYQCFGGPCCYHLQGEVNGAGRKGICMVLEWSAIREQSSEAKRKWEGVV